MGFPTKLQLIKRKASQQWYVNFPSALAQAMDFAPGEVVEWAAEDRSQLVLNRPQAPPSPLKKLSLPPPRPARTPLLRSLPRLPGPRRPAPRRRKTEPRPQRRGPHLAGAVLCWYQQALESRLARNRVGILRLSPMPIEYHEENRLSWNAATTRHRSHRPKLIELYKTGHNNLHREEIELLGEIRGRKLVHLQCNDGQDTLSISRHLGAIALGVDISDTAIELARKLSAETQIPAEFVRADLFDWFDSNQARFDVAYTSYGALIWISNLTRWANGVAACLKPGGRFVLVEFHPFAYVFDFDWTPHFDYMGGKRSHSEGVGDYVGDDFEGQFRNPHPAHEFSWGVAEVVSALLGAGLRLEDLREYPYSNGWRCFPEMRAGEHRRMYLPDDKPCLPLMFSVVARKPE